VKTPYKETINSLKSLSQDKIGKNTKEKEKAINKQDNDEN